MTMEALPSFIVLKQRQSVLKSADEKTVAHMNGGQEMSSAKSTKSASQVRPVRYLTKYFAGGNQEVWRRKKFSKSYWVRYKQPVFVKANAMKQLIETNSLF